MADRRWPPAAPELERALIDLGERVDYPPTPNLAERLRRPLAEGRASRRPTWLPPRPGRRLAWGLLAALLVVAAALALSPEVRTVVAERLGLRGIEIFHLPPGPTPTLPLSPSPTPTALGSPLLLGQRLSLEQARTRAPFAVLAPSLPELGGPDEVYFGEPPLGGQVALVYAPRPGLASDGGSGVSLLLTMFRGALDPRFYAKGVGPGTRMEELAVDSGRGVWLTGQPHFFMYRNRAGQITDETIRLAGNVLLWERGELTLRLEGSLGKEEALRIARSLR